MKYASEKEKKRDQLPAVYGMERRFESCETISDVVEVLEKAVRNHSWDEPAWTVALFVLNQKFGHLSVHDSIEEDNGKDEEIKELKDQIKGLKMAKGKLESQVKKLKEK